jgi:hypothetical protein
MVSPVPREPQVLHASYSASDTEPADPGPACVDCALEGAPALLDAVYTVSGTVLCKNHAIVARKLALQDS